MQFGGGGTPPVGVLFDGPFDGLGDLLALAALRGLQQKSEARVIAISVNRPDFGAAQFCDGLKRAWGIAFSLPVGLADGDKQTTPAYARLLAEKANDGAPLFTPMVAKFTDSADPATVLRNGLTASMPKNSILVASGSAATAIRLTGLRGSKPLIEATVRRLVLVGVKDPAEIGRAVEAWPGEVCVCGAGFGEIRCPAEQMQADFPGGRVNAVGEAYRAFGAADVDLGAAAAGLFAVRGEGTTFSVAEGKPRRVSIEAAQSADVLKAVMEVAVPGAQGMDGGRGRGRRGGN